MFVQEIKDTFTEARQLFRNLTCLGLADKPVRSLFRSRQS